MGSLICLTFRWDTAMPADAVGEKFFRESSSLKSGIRGKQKKILGKNKARISPH